MKNKNIRLRIQIQGPDHKGIIATITQFVFKNGGNIEDIDQRCMDSYFVMNMLVDFGARQFAVKDFYQELVVVAKSVGMAAKINQEFTHTKKNTALLVTKEDHCLQDLVRNIKAGVINANIKAVIGNQPDLGLWVKRQGLPFFYFPSDKKKVHEAKILAKLAPLDIDLIVLARYMQILSPEFVFRYEGRIINIHPSLLPAFPGPRSYEQAYNKGVDYVGVTAHFVTTDLDEGPIICQEAFAINKTRADVASIQARGRVAEVKCLRKAVKLYCDNKLNLRRGKVYIK